MLRNKTRERLTVEQQKRVEDFINSILGLAPQTVRRFVWEFTHRPESARVYGLDIDKEAALSVRSDILVQYRKKHPDWDYAKKYNKEEYSETTAYLRKAVKGDEIIVHEIMDRIFSFVYHLNETAINREVFLLSSERANYKFGGLRNLSFSEDETRFLLEYAGVIGYTLAKVSQDMPYDVERIFFEEGKEIFEEEKKVKSQDIHDQKPPAKITESSKEKYAISQKIAYLLGNDDVIKKIFEILDLLKEASDFLENAGKEHDIEWLLKNRETIESLFQNLSKLQ